MSMDGWLVSHRRIVLRGLWAYLSSFAFGFLCGVGSGTQGVGNTILVMRLFWMEVIVWWSFVALRVGFVVVAYLHSFG